MHPMLIRGLTKIQNQAHEQLLEAYQLFDNRNKGYIDANGLGEAMKALGYQIDKKQIQEMIANLGQSNRGTITKEEFKKFMTARLDHRDDPQDLKQAFQYLDSSKKKKISEKDLQKFAQEIGQNKEQCLRIIFEADKDKDGFINFQEFQRVIKKTSYY